MQHCVDKDLTGIKKVILFSRLSIYMQITDTLNLFPYLFDFFLPSPFAYGHTFV